METLSEVVRQFYSKYYPPSKMEKLRNTVANFQQVDDESFTECWERFNELCRKCPGPIGEQGDELQSFYKGLTLQNKSMVNSSAGGSIVDLTYPQVRDCSLKLQGMG